MNTAPLNLPDREAINLAREGATGLSRLLNDMPNTDRAVIKMDGVDLILPRVAIELLREILADMSQGSAVSIVPLKAEFTTQQAADYLNVSRPYLVKLLEAGEISHIKVGTHRRIKFEDLIEHKERMQKKSNAAMNKLMDLSQEYKMGYE
jgi:excisionase family DNA binding protein